MKRIFVCLILLGLYQSSTAQDESYQDHRHKQQDKDKDATTSFDWNRIFTGGSISLGYTTNTNGGYYTTSTFNIGAIPEIGYSVSELLDLGISGTINYYNITTDQTGAAAQHTTDYGLGVFARIHPLENFFIQAMPEQDWSINKLIAANGTGKYSYQSTAFLLGVGYGHRIIGQSYFYTLLMLDVAKDINSPYIDYNSGAPIPILRGGFNFYLGKRK